MNEVFRWAASEHTAYCLWAHCLLWSLPHFQKTCPTDPRYELRAATDNSRSRHTDERQCTHTEGLRIGWHHLGWLMPYKRLYNFINFSFQVTKRVSLSCFSARYVSTLSVTSGFRRFLKWDLRTSGMLQSADWYLPTFRDNLSAPSSRIKHLHTEDPHWVLGPWN
jgi:hypothetical protein